MDESTGVWLVAALAFLFVGWYLIGGQLQRRARERYVRTLGETAQQLSESRQLPRIREIGQAGFQLTVDDAIPPYTKLAIVTLLMPRESILLLVAAVARRRGDRVVMRADLRERPRAASNPAASAPLTQLSLSRESPHVIAVLDGGWVRSHEPREIAAALQRAAGAAR